MNDRLGPGGAYCFSGWVAPESKIKTAAKPVIEEEVKSEFDEWNMWMKKHIKETENTKTKAPDTKTKPVDVAWEVQVGQVRELQRQRAQKIALAVKNDKLAEIFKKRFERSEKFAVVSEPRPRQKEVKEPEREDDDAEEEVEEVEVVNEKGEEETPREEEVQSNMWLDHPIDVSHLFQTPAPWLHKVESLPPPPPEKNFNRTPKLFAASYESPYYY